MLGFERRASLLERWREVALSEVAEIEMGQAPPGDTYNGANKGVPFIQGCAEFGERHPVPLKWCTAEKAKRAHDGDVLLSVRAPVGRINRADQQLIIGRGVAAIRGSSAASTDYLEEAIAYREPELQSVAAGSTFTAVTKKDVERLSIPLPPLDDQQRIVDLLAAVRSLDNALAWREETAVRLRQAYLESVFRATESVALNAYASFANGTTFPRRYQGETEGDFPFFKVSDSNLAGNERRLTRATNWVSNDVRVALRGRIWPKGSIVFPRVGGALAGEKRRQLTQDSLVDDNQIIALPVEGVDPDFLYACLVSIKLASLAQAGVVPSINQEIVGRVRVPKVDLGDQRIIGSTCASLDDEVIAVRRLREAARLLHDSLRADLISGGLRLSESYDRLLASSVLASKPFVTV